MKAPRLTLVPPSDPAKRRKLEIHEELCKQCREAESPLDLCVHGLDLFLEERSIKDILEIAERLKS